MPLISQPGDSIALHSRMWLLIDLAPGYRRALCGHALPALLDIWILSVESRCAIVPIRHPWISYGWGCYLFFISLRVGGWVGLRVQLVDNFLKVAYSGPGMSHIRSFLATSLISNPWFHCMRLRSPIVLRLLWRKIYSIVFRLHLL